MKQLLLLAICLIALVGCNNRDSDKTSAKSKGTIGVSLLTLDNPFFKVIGDNITREGKKQGYETIVVSGDKDVAKQSNQIKDFIVKKVAAIVLSPCDSKAIVPVIQEANAAGIPVFTVDIPCNESGVKIVTQITTDNYGGGKEAGVAMIEALGVKWTPKTGQSNKLLSAVQERGNHAKETEVPHGGGEGSGGVGSREG
jgi:ribose transport system substrate-binding protein